MKNVWKCQKNRDDMPKRYANKVGMMNLKYAVVHTPCPRDLLLIVLETVFACGDTYKEP